jgi:hypothetical protein
MALAESSRETVHEHTTRGNQIYENRQLFRRSAGYVLPRCRFPTNIAAFEHNGRLYFLFDDTIGRTQRYYQRYTPFIDSFKYECNDTVAASVE